MVELNNKRMKQSKPGFEYKELKRKRLPADLEKLARKADKMTKLAYAPYSNFHVGAALITKKGKIIGGCNQENVSYPLCICAERVALYTYGAQTKLEGIKALYVTAHNPKKPLHQPCMPCGACRQVIQEYEHRQGSAIKVYVSALGLPYVHKIDGINAILPVAFDQSALI